MCENIYKLMEIHNSHLVTKKSDAQLENEYRETEDNENNDNLVTETMWHSKFLKQRSKNNVNFNEIGTQLSYF